MSSQLGFAEKNDYLKTILMPYHYATGIPDLDMNTSVVKSVSLTHNFSAPVSGSGLLIYRPQIKDKAAIEHWIWHALTGAYVYNRDIMYDEDISESFTWARFVSGALKVISSTTSGGQFALSGNITAVHYQDLPDISKLRYEQISSFKRNHADCVQSELVQNGVVSLAQPTGAHPYVTYNTANTFSVNGMVIAADEYYSDGGSLLPDLTGWKYDQAYNAEIYYLQKGTVAWDKYIPVNATGKVEMNATLYLSNSGPQPMDIELSFMVTHRSITDDGETVMNNQIYTRLAGNIPANSTTNFSLIMPASKFDGPFDEISINVRYSSVPTQALVIQGGTMQFKFWTYYQDGAIGPGALIGYQSVTPGQQITLAGVANYEAVPSSSLARQLTTDFNTYDNPFDIELAEKFLYIAPKYGLRMLMPIPEYESNLALMKYETYLTNAFLASASGFGNALRHLGSLLGPVAKAVAPGLANSLLPGSGQMVNNLLGNSASFRQPIIGSSASFRTNDRSIFSGKASGGQNDLKEVDFFSTLEQKEDISRKGVQPGLTGSLNPHSVSTTERTRGITENFLASFDVKRSKEHVDARLLSETSFRPKYGASAGLLESPEFDAAVDNILMSYKMYQIEDYHAELDTTGKLDGEFAAAAKTFKANGIAREPTLPIRAVFPLAVGGSGELAVLTACSDYIGNPASDDALVYVRYSDEFPVLILPDPQFHANSGAAVMLALHQAMVDGNWPSDVTCVVHVVSRIPFEGMSLGLAAYMAISGFANRVAYTGAVGANRLWLPDKITNKVEATAGNDLPLAIAAEPTDLLGPGEQVNALDTQMGRFRDRAGKVKTVFLCTSYAALTIVGTASLSTVKSAPVVVDRSSALPRAAKTNNVRGPAVDLSTKIDAYDMDTQYRALDRKLPPQMTEVIPTMIDKALEREENLKRNGNYFTEDMWLTLKTRMDNVQQNLANKMKSMDLAEYNRNNPKATQTKANVLKPVQRTQGLQGFKPSYKPGTVMSQAPIKNTPNPNPVSRPKPATPQAPAVPNWKAKMQSRRAQAPVEIVDELDDDDDENFYLDLLKDSGY